MFAVTVLIDPAVYNETTPNEPFEVDSRTNVAFKPAFETQ